MIKIRLAFGETRLVKSKTGVHYGSLMLSAGKRSALTTVVVKLMIMYFSPLQQRGLIKRQAVSNDRMT